MSTLGWLLLVALGVALGFSAARVWPGSAAKLTQLERERDAAREDLRNYQKDVGSHFEQTAELFDKVTTDYRRLYEHLAVGARQLGAIPGESVEAPLAEPERRRLSEGASVAAEESASDEQAADVAQREPEAESEPKPAPEADSEPASEPPVEPGQDDESQPPR